MEIPDRLATTRWATTLAVNVERLNALDDIWTRYNADPPGPEQRSCDLPEARLLVTEMVGLIGEIAAGSGRLRRLLNELPSDLEEDLTSVLSGHPLGNQAQTMRPDPPFAGQVAQASEIVERDAAGAIAGLAHDSKR